MGYVLKNKDFELKYVDPATGYGFIYSIRGHCFILNPVAVSIWNILDRHVDVTIIRKLFSDVMSHHGAGDYVYDVILEMDKMGIVWTVNTLQDNNRYNIDDKVVDNDYSLAHIYYYITSDCNARCYHCYLSNKNPKNDSLQGRDNDIGKEDFLSFVEAAIPLGLKHIKITGGEPLLRPDLLEIIEGIKLLQMNVTLETNGFLINEGIADFFADKEVRVSISLDGGSKSIHDNLRGQHGSFERVTQAIRMLSDRGCEITVIMAVSKRNLGELENIVKVARDSGGHKVKINPIITIGKAISLKHTNMVPSIDEVKEIIKMREQLEDKYNVKIMIEAPMSFFSLSDIVNRGFGNCQFCNTIGILSDGSISFCGIGFEYPELILGRINDPEFNIKNFWEESEPLINVRRISSGKFEGVCHQCYFESLCRGGCRGFAYAEFRSLQAPNPWCQRAVDEGLFPHYYLKPK